jgi:hypothetical protein
MAEIGSDGCESPEMLKRVPGDLRYDVYVLKATIETDAESGPTARYVDRFDEALQTVARSITRSACMSGSCD